MADLNALIAQGAQFRQAPDPFVQYGQMQQLEQNRQTNELNQMKMQEAQATMAERNALRQLNPSAADYESQLFKVNPTLGIAYRKEASSAAAQKTAAEKQNIESAKMRQGMLGQAFRDISTRPSDANITAHMEDVLASTLFSPEEKSRVQKLSANLLSMPVEKRGSFLSLQGATAGELNVKPTLTNLARLQTEMAALPLGDLRRNQYISAIKKESESAPVAGSALSILQSEMAALPAGDPRRAEYAARIKKETTFAPGVTITMPAQEKAFEIGLGEGQSKRILESQASAQDAAEILRTNQVGRDLLKSGAITGTGADFLVGFNNALKQAGIDFGYADAAANSQAYAAALGSNVGRIIKQFGAGTGLSDADREYAAQIAGGKIALTEAALRKILDINDRASNRVIDLHNKNVSGIKTNIPLTVEKPTLAAPPPAAAKSAPAADLPLGAIDKLLSGGGTDAEFDKIFGSGAAAGVRKRAKGVK